MAEAAGFDIRRMLLVGGVVLVVVFSGLVILFRGCTAGPRTSSYTIIYSNLELRDAANVIARLKELAIPYEIREDGRAIAVPKEKSDQARLGLAEKNLPLGGAVGWEIFDQNRMGATDFDRRIQLIRAISGELSRTIRRIEGVADVRVQIVIPETKLFAVTVAPVTASVLMRIQPGIELSREKINGIVHLVASSVENLQPENVTVIDDTGNILSANIQITAEAAPLAPIPPTAEKVVPQPVSIEANPAEVILTREAGAATLEAKATPGAIVTAEITAVASMSAEERILLKAQAKKEIERDLTGKAQELLNRFYPPNSVIIRVGVEIVPAKENEIKARDLKIKRLEAVILVDNRIDLSPKLKQATFSTAAAAIGYDKKRGDKIILQLVPFHLATLPITAVPTPAASGEIKKVTPVISLRPIFISIAVLLGLGLLIWIISRLVSGRKEAAELEGSIAAEANPMPVTERAPVFERVKNQAESNPEAIAELLKKWLSE